VVATAVAGMAAARAVGVGTECRGDSSAARSRGKVLPRCVKTRARSTRVRSVS
jgi:hypothetical protein